MGWFHGTPLNFKKFDSTKVKEQGFGKGIYFTTSVNEAKIYAKQGQILEIDPSNLKILDAEKSPQVIKKIADNLGMPLLGKEKRALYNLWDSYGSHFKDDHGLHLPDAITNEIIKLGYDATSFDPATTEKSQWLVVYSVPKIKIKGPHMKFISKIEAKIDRYLPESNAWDYLPAEARGVLRSRGYKKTDFKASVVPANDTIKKPYVVFSYKVRASTLDVEDIGKYLFLAELKKLAALGVDVVIAAGVLSLQYYLEEYHGVKEVSP